MCGAMPSSTRPIRTVTPVCGNLAWNTAVQLGMREDRLAEIPADLARVGVERRNHLDVRQP